MQLAISIICMLDFYVDCFTTIGGGALEQQISTFLNLWPFNVVPYGVVTPNHISLCTVILLVF